MTDLDMLAQSLEPAWFAIHGEETAFEYKRFLDAFTANAEGPGFTRDEYETINTRIQTLNVTEWENLLREQPIFASLAWAVLLGERTRSRK